MRNRKSILILSILITLLSISPLLYSNTDCDIFAPEAFSSGQDANANQGYLKELGFLAKTLENEERQPAGRIQDFSKFEEDINSFSEIFSKNNSEDTVTGSM